jgi:amidohydrolase
MTTAGKIKLVAGQSQASVDSFEAHIHGKGGHGAAPHDTIDPIFILAQVINAIHGIRARRIKPIRPAVISIGAVHAGEAPNVIPDSVFMRGTIRAFDEETRAQLANDLEGAFGVARALGGDFDLNIMRGYPSSYNDSWTVDLMREVTGDLFGADEVIEGEPTMGAEDFSYMLQRAPGAMFMLGTQVGDDERPHHSPIFDIDESYFYRGAAVLAETACRLLREKANS